MTPILPGIDRIHEGTRFRIKDQNKARIYHLICAAPGVTRKELISQTGMRPSTVSEMVQQLVADRLVVERGRRNVGMQGRPEVCLYANHHRLCVVALYVVSTELKAVMLGSDGMLFMHESRPLSTNTDNEGVLRAVRELVGRLVAQRPRGSKILGVSITVPGYVNVHTKTWYFAARWPRIRDLVFTTIENELNLPLVVNRALDAGLQHLMLRNPAYASGGTLLFHWGYGIGAAYAYDGVTVKTSFGSFCEIGHLSLYPDSGKVCTCGAIGCLETVAALWALIPGFRQTDQGVPEDELEFKRHFVDCSVEEYTSVRRAVEAIVQAIAILQTTFLPDRIVIYGPLLCHSSVYDLVVERVRCAVSPFAAERLHMEFMDTSFDGDVIGGASELFLPAFRDYLTAD